MVRYATLRECARFPPRKGNPEFERKENYDEEISALSSVLAKVEKNGQTGEIDLRNYKVGGDVILKQTKK